MKFTMDPWDKDTFYKTKLKIYWDNSSDPAVDMPIGCFFGGGGDTIGKDVSTNNFTNLFYGYSSTNKYFYSYWPMPYWSRAKVVIENNSGKNINSIQVDVKYKPSSAYNYPSGEAGYFHAKRTIDISHDSAYYSNAFYDVGRGKVVGIILYSTGYNMDGDEFTYIDDSLTPQIHGDGTEDDHNQGWGGYAVQKPLWGGLINGYDGGYRTYYNESYVYDRNIKILYEHSNCGASTGQQTDGMIWYYKKDAGGVGSGYLKLTDEIDVGDSASESSHNYTVNTGTWSGTTSSNYDGMEQNKAHIPCVDNGRAYKGYSQFTVAIDSSNNGVLLSRRINRYNNNLQQADVYVDGVKVTEAPWYFCDLNPTSDQAFADIRFVIPRSYTQGKSSITVKVRYVNAKDPTNGINEYYYWVYSYASCTLPTWTPEPTPTPTPTPEATPAGTNLALGATASASSIWDSNYTAAKANDNNINTRWNSASGTAAGEWLALDFGISTTFNAVNFAQETTWTRITSYKAQYWNGSGWVDAYTGGTMGDLETDRFSAVTSSKIRLLVNGTSGNTPTIKEFRVYNEGGATSTPTPTPTPMPVPGTNLALSATATASSIWDSNYTADKAKDDNMSTRWNSAFGKIAGEWLQYEWASNQTFNRCQFEQCTTWTRITNYNIQYWYGIGWQNAYTGGTMADTQTNDFPAVTSVKVRLLVNNTTGNTPTIWEFRVYNTHTDEFNNSTLDSAWSWVREDSANWSLIARSGYLRIVCQSGELYGTNNNAKNLLLRTAPAGDWTMTARMEFSPVSNYQQAGLLVYKDDDNYLKLSRAYSGGQCISGAKEIGGAYTQQLPSLSATSLDLKITKAGTTYTMYYSSDGGSNWTQVAQYTGVDFGSSFKVGLGDFGGPAGVNADFDWFDIR